MKKVTIVQVENIILYGLKIFFFLIFAYSASFIVYEIIYGCNNKTNIYIDQLMLSINKSPSYYCDLVNRSVLEQDEEAIREFSLLHFSDGGAYVHGDILIQIVQEIGEDKYLKSIESLSSAEKYGIGGHFEMGKDEGAGDWERLFPKIYKELDGDVPTTGGFTRPSDRVYCASKINIGILQGMLNAIEKTPKYYCDLVDKCLIEQNEEAIRELSLLSFSDGAAYEHGAVLIQIVQKIGEEKYLKSIESLSSEDKYRIKQYFIAGVKNGREYHEGGNSRKELFPKIYAHMEKYAYLEK